jgi:Asp-tRNA(Asn)/Glu-tRNA(Gln) amidotransferase C subunit
VKLSDLTYLRYPEDDTALVRDVASLVAWTGTITEMDVSAYEPMYTPLEVTEYYAVLKPNKTGHDSASAAADRSHPEALRLRPDAVTDGQMQSEMLNNAKYKHRGFFVVPKVVDQEE